MEGIQKRKGILPGAHRLLNVQHHMKIVPQRAAHPVAEGNVLALKAVHILLAHGHALGAADLHQLQKARKIPLLRNGNLGLGNRSVDHHKLGAQQRCRMAGFFININGIFKSALVIAKNAAAFHKAGKGVHGHHLGAAVPRNSRQLAHKGRAQLLPGVKEHLRKRKAQFRHLLQSPLRLQRIKASGRSSGLHQPTSFSMAARRVQMHSSSAAKAISSLGGKEGAMRMLLSCGSMP